MVVTRAATSDWEEVGDQWRLVVMEDRTLASSRHWHTIRLFLIIFLVFISYVYNIDIFRSGRISSVYIVGWLLLVGCHTFSKLVNFECVGMLECWCVGVL